MKIKLPGLEKLSDVLDRFKYPILVLLVGIAMVLWPSRKTEQAEPPETVENVAEVKSSVGDDYCREMERHLESMLSQVEGAGRVKVLLTLKTGPSSYYQTDVTRSEKREGEDESLSLEEKTVILNRGSAYDEPAIVNTAYPVFQGALIVAEGGADPSVKLQLSTAVAALLGLGIDQITVVKMK